MNKDRILMTQLFAEPVTRFAVSILEVAAQAHTWIMFNRLFYVLCCVVNEQFKTYNACIISSNLLLSKFKTLSRQVHIIESSWSFQSFDITVSKTLNCDCLSTEIFKYLVILTLVIFYKM